MKTEVTIYTMINCPYCMRAKALLKSRDVNFAETLVAHEDRAKWDELEKRSGMRTMPQIFYGEKLIGGYTELAALDQHDGLASLRSKDS